MAAPLISRVAQRYVAAQGCSGGCGCGEVAPLEDEVVGEIATGGEDPDKPQKGATLAQRVAARFVAETVAMDHPSEEAKKKYLQEHPKADPSNHKVKQHGGGGAGPVDHALAESEGPKGHARFEANKKSLGEMKSLKKKVDDADPVARKKFDREYDKLYESGEKAVASVKKLLQKYTKAHESLEGDAKEYMDAGLEMLHTYVKDWEHNKLDHHKARGGMAHSKMNQAESTYAYAQQLDAAVKDFAKFLKDPEQHQVDESWRHT